MSSVGLTIVGLVGGVVSTVVDQVLDARVSFPARSVTWAAGRVILTSPSRVRVRVSVYVILSIVEIPDTVALTSENEAGISDPVIASLNTRLRANPVRDVGDMIGLIDDITAVGCIVSITYAWVADPVNPALLAVTSRIPDVDITPPVHVTGATAGSIPQLNPLFPAPENATFVMISPLELTTSIVVSVMIVFLRIVGAVILTTGG
jgi:hypothetical protein